MSDYKKIVLKNSPVPGAVPLQQFLDYGELALNYADNKIYYKSLNGNIVVHETPDIDIYPSPNSIVRRNLDGSGIFNGVISEGNDADIYSIYATHSSAATAKIKNTGVCTGAEISSDYGIGAEINSITGTGARIYSESGYGASISSQSNVGAEIYSVNDIGAEIRSIEGIGAEIKSTENVGLNASSISGTGAVIYSTSGVGLKIYTEEGDYNALFGQETDIKKLGVSAPDVTVDWLNYDGSGTLITTGKLQSSEITQDRTWSLPNASGTILLDTTLNLGTSGKTINVDSEIGTDVRGSLSPYSYVPFETIGAAVAASTIGDLVVVKPGTYTISTAIDLNGKGNIYFEPGTSVTVDGLTAFTCTANESKKILGYADFTCYNAGGIVSLSTLGPILQFECNYITGASSGTLFSTSNSANLTVTIRRSIAASNVASTVFSLSGSSKITVNATEIVGGTFLNSSGTANSQFVSHVKRVNANGAGGGILITSIGIAEFYINEYTHAGVGLVCSWTQNTQSENISFVDTFWKSTNNASHITLTTTETSLNTKKLRLLGTHTMYGITNSNVCISSTIDPTFIFIQQVYAATIANYAITFKVGAFTVDSQINLYN